jgi:hypothetical protein
MDRPERNLGAGHFGLQRVAQSSMEQEACKGGSGACGFRATAGRSQSFSG